MSNIRKYPPVTTSEVKLLLAQGCKVEQIAAVLGCSVANLRGAMGLFGWRVRSVADVRREAVRNVTKSADSVGA